jgi:hypothetical protein
LIKRKIKYTFKFQDFLQPLATGLPDATIMTSMVHVGNNQFSWDGENQVKNIEVKNTTLGNCTGLSKLQLSRIYCDEKHNFMCESVIKEKTTSNFPKTTPIAE